MAAVAAVFCSCLCSCLAACANLWTCTTFCDPSVSMPKTSPLRHSAALNIRVGIDQIPWANRPGYNVTTTGLPPKGSAHMPSRLRSRAAYSGCPIYAPPPSLYRARVRGLHAVDVLYSFSRLKTNSLQSREFKYSGMKTFLKLTTQDSRMCPGTIAVPTSSC